MSLDHREKLLEVYRKSFNIADISNISDEMMDFLKIIVNNIDKRKGVYTVLITLMVHKLLEPRQDIRYHRSEMENGFSARTIDTKFITPTLRGLGLISMAESGWLTRSLEQSQPYTLDYRGKISGKGLKEAFLMTIDAFQKNKDITENMLRIILNGAILFKENNLIEIRKLDNADEITITAIIGLLKKTFYGKIRHFGRFKIASFGFLCYL